MLEDPAEERYWGNIVVALGNTADVRVFETLKAFVESGVSTLSPTRYQAKKAALISIGYLANKTNYPAAKDYLMRGGENAGAYWASLRCNNPNISRAANRNVQLGAASVLAAGLVARSDTERFLTELESRSERFSTATSGADPEFLESYRSAIKTAIETSRAIRDAGGLAPISNVEDSKSMPERQRRGRGATTSRDLVLSTTSKFFLAYGSFSDRRVVQASAKLISDFPKHLPEKLKAI